MAQLLLLLGLEEETSSRLAAAIPADKYQVHIVPGASTPLCLGELDTLRPALICLPAEPGLAEPLMQAVRTRMANAPIILVSQNPNLAEWKLALEEGAADYFGPPFLPGQLDAILSSASASLPMGRYFGGLA